MAHRGYVMDETTPIVFFFLEPVASESEVENPFNDEDYDDPYLNCRCEICRPMSAQELAFEDFEAIERMEREVSHLSLDEELATADDEMPAIMRAWFAE